MEGKERNEYKPLTHEELVQEVYRLMHDMSLDEQAALVQTIKKAIKHE